MYYWNSIFPTAHRHMQVFKCCKVDHNKKIYDTHLLGIKEVWCWNFDTSHHNYILPSHQLIRKIVHRHNTISLSVTFRCVERAERGGMVARPLENNFVKGYRASLWLHVLLYKPNHTKCESNPSPFPDLQALVDEPDAAPLHYALYRQIDTTPLGTVKT